MFYYSIISAILFLAQNSLGNVKSNTTIERPPNAQEQYNFLLNRQADENTRSFINQTLSRMALGVCFREVP